MTFGVEELNAAGEKAMIVGKGVAPESSKHRFCFQCGGELGEHFVLWYGVSTSAPGRRHDIALHGNCAGYLGAALKVDGKQARLAENTTEECAA
jgi:hypothetical protein